MELACTIKERGFFQRALIKEHKNCSRDAWLAAGKMWHLTFRDRRFTPAHAKKAGYALRKGEQTGLSQTAFWNSYTGQKLRKWHHKNPLQWSGKTRERVQAATITATNTHYGAASGSIWGGSQSGGGVRIAYPGASKLNYRRWPSSPHMADEFRRVLPEELDVVARAYDAALQVAMNADQTVTVRKVA
jgi:hypothetical protein